MMELITTRPIFHFFERQRYNDINTNRVYVGQ